MIIFLVIYEELIFKKVNRGKNIENQLPIRKRHLEAHLKVKVEILVKILRYFIAGDLAKIPFTG